MNPALPFIVACAVAFAMLQSCGSTASQPAPTTLAWTHPTSYAAATRAAVNPTPLSMPVGPWSCKPVNVRATPGTILEVHGINGSTIYTADASGRLVNPTTRFSLDLLMQPYATLWMSVVSPADGQVEWSGAEFTSIDGMSATWTAPSQCSIDDPLVTIEIDVVSSPQAGG